MGGRLRIGIVLVVLLFAGCAGEDAVSAVELTVSVSGEPGNVHIEKSANNGTSAMEEARVTFDFLGTESSGGALTEFSNRLQERTIQEIIPPRRIFELWSMARSI